MFLISQKTILFPTRAVTVGRIFTLRDSLLPLLACALVAGCNDLGNPAPGLPVDTPVGRMVPFGGELPMQVVTTCGMVSDIVREVAGDRGNVVSLMGEGVDPHLYKPTRNDVQELLDADIVFYSGLMLEGRMADTFAKVGRSGKPVFAVSETLDESTLLEPPEFEGHWDPHVWMDVAAWSEAVGFVAEALCAFDADGAEQYQQRAAAYQEKLKGLDEYVRQTIATIPDEQRVLITAHDAFGYFSRAYDIPVRSVQGISTESEAGVDDINQLVSFIVERKIRAIFVESSVSQKNIQAVIEGAANSDWEVTIGGELYSDAMGPAGTYEGTYVGMLDHNATTIARALGGRAPDGGWQGELSAGE